MYPLPSTSSENVSIRPSIFLEYGLDGAAGEDASCEVCERGMRFKSRWQFDVGTVLNIAFSIEDGTPSRVEAEGMVVECSPAGDRIHLTTLAFVEVPRELKANLGKVSARFIAAPSPKTHGAAVGETLA